MKEINEKTKDLSIIIPFVGEYPQALFTIQSIAQSLVYTSIDFEIIAVNNYCPEFQNQLDTSFGKSFNRVPDTFEYDLEEYKKAHQAVPAFYKDKSGEAIKAASKINDWLVYMEVDDRLSHWECKRRACEVAKGDVFFFADAHTVPSADGIAKMYCAYLREGLDVKGSVHLPLTYKILESHRLIYKLAIDGAFYGYSFTGFRKEEGMSFYEVPCMSTCGMMVSKKIYEAIGGWPENMTMYGGGENYFNFTLSVCGFKKYIYQYGTLFHHGERRDYHYTYDGMLHNRMAAHYLFGGLLLLEKFTRQSKGNPAVLTRMAQRVADLYRNHRGLIRTNQIMEIEDWAAKWTE